MRLAYLDPNPVPGLGPPQIQILYTVDGLARAGFQVVLMTPRPIDGTSDAMVLGRAMHPNVTTHYLPNLRKRWWLPSGSSRIFYRMATRAVTRLDVEIVLVRNLKMADRLLQEPGCPPLFFETHEVFAQTFRENYDLTNARNKRRLSSLIDREHYVYANARGIFALTRSLENDLRKEYGFHTPTEVLPDGVDISQMDAAPEIAVTMQERTVLYLGSLHPWKGVEVVVRAISEVPNARLKIVGGTRDRIGALRILAKALGVAERVDFVGQVPPNRRFDYIKPATVCVLPLTRKSIASRYTSPLKLFEYMAAGKAIVVSDLPSMREVITDGVHGLMVAPEDPHALAGAIRRLLEDRPLRDRLGDAARRLAEGYDWKQRALRIMDFVSQVLRANPGSAP